MRNYQTLALTVGIAGIAVLGFQIYELLDSEVHFPGTFWENLLILYDSTSPIMISVMLYGVAMTVSFGMDRTRILGLVLFMLAFGIVISSEFYGLPGIALAAAGILAIIYRNESDPR